MNIIFISNKSERAKKLTLTRVHITLLMGLFLLVTLILALSLNYWSLRYADRIDMPVLRAVLVSPQEERHQKIQTHLQEISMSWLVSWGKCKRNCYAWMP